MKKNQTNLTIPKLVGILLTVCIWAFMLIWLVCFDGMSAGIQALFFLIGAVVSTAVIWIANYFIDKNAAENVLETVSEETKIHQDLLKFLEELKNPVVICSSDGFIEWTNGSFEKNVALKKDLIKTGNLGNMIETFSDCYNATGENGVDIHAFNARYNVRSYFLPSVRNDIRCLIFTDISEEDNIMRSKEEAKIVLAYIIIDNTEDLNRYVKDYYRTASGEVEKILKEWADESDGILLEYEKDKYLFAFENRYLESFIDDKFSVLDKARQIKVGDSGIKVTLSIGLSSCDGTLEEKEKVAMQSLEAALRRGGDQAVARNGDDMFFIGGKTKTQQKSKPIEIRDKATLFATIVCESDNVIIMGHKSPDFDALGGCIGIARLCSFFGVKVHIIADKNNPSLRKCFDMLSGIPDYEHIFINQSEAIDMITSQTLVVIADVNNEKQFDAPDVVKSAFRVVIIDHHISTENYDKNIVLMDYINSSASSCCEMVSKMLEICLPSGELKKAEAEIMFAGMLLDTKQFSRNTGEDTFSAALYLRSQNADPTVVQELFKTDMDDYIREARFQKDVITYNSHFIISVNRETDNTQQDRIMAAKNADSLLSLNGVQASFAICKIENSVIISSRSIGKVNVQKIMENLGGGGHYDAAATQLDGITVDEAVEKLKAAIDNYIENL